MNQTTEHQLEDLPGKDLPEDPVIRDQNLRSSLDVQEFEEQPKDYDPKYARTIFSTTCSCADYCRCWPVRRKWLVMSLVSWLCLVR
jgi:hypothetical protein